MYSLKGVWAGQTFALATSNDSKGRKSRIRRSKEERKAMVESFIKKYQSQNDGSFPSLNLTHKEVGGSFYTVREIVREIIQENRVLGPAKFSLQEQNSDANSQQYPVGSIAIEPQAQLDQSANVDQIVSRHLQIATADMTIHDDGQYRHFEHGKLVNGFQSVEMGEDSGETVSMELENERDSDSCHRESAIMEPSSDDFGHEETAGMELSLYVNGEKGNDHRVDDERFVKGIRIDGTESPANKIFEGDTETEVLGTDKAVVEKVPLRPVSNEIDRSYSDGIESPENTAFEGNSETEVVGTEEVAVETFPLRPGTNETDGSYSDGIESPENKMIEAHIETEVLGTDEVAVETFPLRIVTNATDGSYTDGIESLANKRVEADTETEVLGTDTVAVEKFPLRPVTNETEGSHIDGTELPVNKIFEAHTETAVPGNDEVIVEKFPLRRITNETDGSYVTSDDVGDVNGTLGILESEKADSGNTSPVLDTIDSSDEVSKKAAESDPLNPIEIASGTSDRANLEDISKDVMDSNDDLTSKTVEHKAQMGVQTKNAQSVDIVSLGAANTASTNMDATSQKAVMIEKGSVITKDNTTMKGSIDRINIESWEGASKKSSGKESNPVLAFFKALVIGFVKFWSE